MSLTVKNVLNEKLVNAMVLKILCSKYSMARASLRAWIRILKREGLSDDEITIALKYLVPAGDYNYVVDTDKCVEVELE